MTVRSKAKQLCCPECGSVRLYRAGFRYPKHGDPVQRWLCRDCGFRFSGAKQGSVPELKIKENIILQSVKKLDSRSDLAQIPVSHSGFSAKKTLNDSSFPFCEDVGSHESPHGSTIGKSINAFASTLVNTKYASRKKAKNLVEVEPLKEGLAGATKHVADIKGKIVGFLWYLQKEGVKESSAKTYGRKLNQLLKHGVNLFNPEEVKTYLAQRQCSEQTKHNIVTAYKGFLKFLGRSWKPLKYKVTAKIPFIPTEEEIDLLIARAGRRLAPLLQLLKETGMRCGEALMLKWMNMDFQRKTVTVTPEKGSSPRILPLTDKTMAMLNTLPRRRDERLFSKGNGIKSNFYRQRRALAAKLNNPRIRKIGFHTLRHWKGTIEYHKTKDIIHVQKTLGHKNIESTMIYINIEQALFQYKNDEYHVKTAKTVEETCKLAKVGFEYFDTVNGIHIYRKRK